MKKLILILFLILPIKYWAQTYNLLPDSCTFCMFLTSTGGTSYTNNMYAFYPEDDTLINGNEYTYFDGVSWEVIPLRQIGNKLLRYVTELDDDVLLMDFDAVPGDTIHGLFDNYHFYSARVEIVDSFQLNDGSYHRYMDLTGFRVSEGWLDSSSWNNDDWIIRWNERGLCDAGGLAYNIPHNYYSISPVYVNATWCTTDPRYNLPNGNACNNCENPTRGDASIGKLNQLQFSVHPNPTNDWLRVVFPFEEKRTLELIDTCGRITQQLICTQSTCELDLSELMRGMYYLRVTSTEGSIGMERVLLN